MTDLLQTVYKALKDLKLQDVVIYDFRGHSPYYDYQVIASASNERQVAAAVNHIRQAIPSDIFLRMEGLETSRWILFDLNSIIVHVMHKEDREFYQIEKIFFEREKISLEENDGI